MSCVGRRTQDAGLQSYKVYAISVYLWWLNMEFVEAPIFTKLVKELLTDEEFRVLQAVLAAHPKMGDVIPGGTGLRKVRWGSGGQSRGKRGGLRVIYYLVRPNVIGLIHIYRKSDRDKMPKELLRIFKQYTMRNLYERF